MVVNRQQSNDFLFSTFALIVSAILVHAVYVVQIRPRAEAILSEQFAQSRVDPNYVAKRSVFVMLKEYEPEACVILMIWSLALLVYRGVANSRQRRLLAQGLLNVPPGMRILPKDTREYARQLESMSRRRSLRIRAVRTLTPSPCTVMTFSSRL